MFSKNSLIAIPYLFVIELTFINPYIKMKSILFNVIFDNLIRIFYFVGIF